MSIQFSKAKSAPRNLKSLDAEILDVEDVCPACGHRLRPLSNAERQRRWRLRQKEKHGPKD